jgi:hypothetical protein
MRRNVAHGWVDEHEHQIGLIRATATGHVPKAARNRFARGAIVKIDVRRYI